MGDLRDDLAVALFPTYGQQDTGRSYRIADAVLAVLAGREAAAVAAVARVEALPDEWERWAAEDHIPARAALNRARAADVRQALTDQCFPGVACGPCKTDERLSCPSSPPRRALDSAGDEPRPWVTTQTQCSRSPRCGLPDGHFASCWWPAEPAGDEPSPCGEVDEAMDAGARFLEHLAASPNRLVREAAQALQAEVVAPRGATGAVHNHGPEDGPGLACWERLTPDGLRGACIAEPTGDEPPTEPRCGNNCRKPDWCEGCAERYHGEPSR